MKKILIALALVLAVHAADAQVKTPEVAKKALDFQIEWEKRKSEEERRAAEDKKCEEAEKEQRDHEIQLAQLASTIKVEVSNVRLLHA